ncbi:MAG: ATP-binding cassette domain-containing protein [Gammaproteobacteria bacterium]
MLSLENITKRFDNTSAVDGLSLPIAEGETTVLIGPSGCGKSTILRLVTGLIRADQGRVLFQGQPLERKDMESFRRHIGYVIQDGGLFPHLTARDNVTIIARYLDWLDSTMAERLVELAELVKLNDEILDRYPAELSGGQRQRVSLMRSLMLDPEILLLDEPFTALDPLIRFELQADMKDIFRRLNKTVLFVTHDMNEAAWLGDSIVLMRDGRVVQKGGYRDLADRPVDEFVRRFLRAQRPPEAGNGGGP